MLISVFTYELEIYTGEQFKAGTDANVSVQLYGERGDTGLRRLMDSKTNSNKFEGGEVSQLKHSRIKIC
mgnify:CR=1 FL=1